LAGTDTRKGDAALVAALAGGASIKEAATRAGLSERTAHRRLDEPAVRAQVAAARADMVASAGGVLARAATAAAATLSHLMSSTYPPSTRLAAARSVLELGSRLREAEEFEARLAALEAASAAQQQGR
jgi:lambda repressor-like predicted transcriptional regulator